jgi:hypothetical protein
VSQVRSYDTESFKQHKKNLDGSGRNTTLPGMLSSVVHPSHSATFTLRSPSSIFRFCASKSRTPLKMRQNCSACVPRMAVWEKVIGTDAIWDNT